MRFLLAPIISLVLGTASAWAEPAGVRVNANIIWEPIPSVPLSEAFHAVEFVDGDDAVVGLWRFSYEDAAIDGAWQAIGLIGISARGEGIQPVIVRVWARGDVTSGDSAELSVSRAAVPPNSVSAFLVRMTSTRGTATITISEDGVVEIEGQRLGVTGP